MKTFWVRAVNLVLIASLIIGYNTVLTLRDKDDQIAKLTAELESANLYKQSVLQSQDAATSGGAYEDGIWKGTAQGFGGDIQVEVTVEGGSITDISIVSAEKEDGAYLSMAEDIMPRVQRWILSAELHLVPQVSRMRSHRHWKRRQSK